MPDTTSRRRPLALVTPTWLALGIFFLLPLAIMLVISFAQRGTYGGIERPENLRHYLDNYRNSLQPIYLKIFWRSIWLAIVTTVLCIIVSYPVAYYIAIAAKPRHKNLLLALVVIPFWTSFLIRTYAWILILRTEGLINTMLMGLHVVHHPLPLLDNEFSVLIGLVYGELPFMILPLYASLEKLDRTLLEAAGDLGASGAGAFWRVTIPLTLPGIIAGIVLVFIPSLGQFIISDLLGGAKSILVGNLIQNQFTFARNKPFGSAVAFELTAMVLAMLVAYAGYARRKGEVLL